MKLIISIILTMPYTMWASSEQLTKFTHTGSCIEVNSLLATKDLDEIAIFKSIENYGEGLLRRGGVDHPASIVCLSACGINLVYVNHWPFLFFPIGETTTEWQGKTWACSRLD